MEPAHAQLANPVTFGQAHLASYVHTRTVCQWDGFQALVHAHSVQLVLRQMAQMDAQRAQITWPTVCSVRHRPLAQNATVQISFT